LPTVGQQAFSVFGEVRIATISVVCICMHITHSLFGLPRRADRRPEGCCVSHLESALSVGSVVKGVCVALIGNSRVHAGAKFCGCLA
jgi:hypothetical protein